jgi:voltage-gated potassium channel
MRGDHRPSGWEGKAAAALMSGSMLFLASYAYLVLAQGEPAWRHTLAEAVLVGCWVLFATDYAVRLALAPRRPEFVRTRWLDLVVLVLPLLRPLRVVQTYARQRQRHGGAPRWSLEGRVIVYTGLTVLLLGFAGSLAVYQAERAAPGANIRSYGDAVWWACSTLTAVGYGDVFPVTTRGRVVGVAMMLTGLGLLGAVLGTFSSWLVGRFRAASTPAPDAERPPRS